MTTRDVMMSDYDQEIQQPAWHGNDQRDQDHEDRDRHAELSDVEELEATSQSAHEFRFPLQRHNSPGMLTERPEQNPIMFMTGTGMPRSAPPTAVKEYSR